MMKIRCEIDPDADFEVIIRAPELTEEVAKLQTLISKSSASSLDVAVIRGDAEVFFPVTKLLYFEAFDGKVYAHTEKDCFICQKKLYELEEILPMTYARASKACIVNTAKIMSIMRGLSGVAEVTFKASEKRISLSRKYYHAVRDLIEETRL